MAEERILLIDDDKEIIDLIVAHQSEIGVDIDSENDGKSGLQKALDNDYDLVIVDGKLPGLDGFEVCRRLREVNSSVAILILTSRSDVAEKMEGLETGADDYVQKPFNIKELLARIRILLKRVRLGKRQVGPTVIRVRELELDLGKHQARLAGNALNLTATEFAVVVYLYENRDRAVTREELTREVWGSTATQFDHTVTSHISRLRSKLDSQDLEKPYIETVKGVGYRFAAD